MEQANQIIDLLTGLIPAGRSAEALGKLFGSRYLGETLGDILKDKAWVKGQLGGSDAALVDQSYWAGVQGAHDQELASKVAFVQTLIHEGVIPPPPMPPGATPEQQADILRRSAVEVATEAPASYLARGGGETYRGHSWSDYTSQIDDILSHYGDAYGAQQ